MNSLFQHILVPVDFTPKNQTALSAAEQIAIQNGASVSLLHVIEFIDFPDDDEIADFYAKLQSRSAEELDKLVDQLDSEINPTVETIINYRSEGIVAYALENAVDLIVMSSHPIDPKRRIGWGTISYQVSALCHYPIMLVKQPSERSTESIS